MEWLRLAYVGGFGLAALACFLSVRRTTQVTGPDTQRGLGALIGLSGGWATIQTIRLTPISQTAQIGLYIIGLVVGLATIGAWLYFCSAYTGHDYHRRPRIRQTALTLYLGIILIKTTNPLHGLYFDTTTTTQPFAHVVFELSVIHWVVTGLSYALASIGFFLLYQMLSESKSEGRILGAIVATTALPLIFYIISLRDTSGMLTLHYEPLGIAVFAIGVLYFADDQFLAIPNSWRRQIIDDIDEAVIVTDDLERIREYNRRAIEMFPTLREREGESLADVSPDLERASERMNGILTLEQDNEDAVRHFYVTATPLTRVDVEVGKAVVCTDVTNVERQRRRLKRKNKQLERQNKQLDDLADAITHELRNTLTIAEGYFELIAAEREKASAGSSDNAIEAVEEAQDRMGRIVTELARLARRGQTVEDIGECSLSAITEAAREAVRSDELSIRIEEDATLRANQALLKELHSTAAQFANLHGATVMQVGTDQDVIVITIDGDPIAEDAIEDAFAYGEAVPSAETGTLFPTMQAIASSHGWTIEIDRTYRAGIRVEIGGVEMLSAPE